jgi:hypothetical protein
MLVFSLIRPRLNRRNSIAPTLLIGLDQISKVGCADVRRRINCEPWLATMQSLTGSDTETTKPAES